MSQLFFGNGTDLVAGKRFFKSWSVNLEVCEGGNLKVYLVKNELVKCSRKGGLEYPETDADGEPLKQVSQFRYQCCTRFHGDKDELSIRRKNKRYDNFKSCVCGSKNGILVGITVIDVCAAVWRGH